MKTIILKSIVLMTILFATQLSRADARCQVKLSFGRGMMQQWTDREVSKIKRMLRKQKYKLVDDENAHYKIKVNKAWGFVCSQGLSWFEAMFQEPGYYAVEIQEGPRLQHKSSQEFLGFGPIVNLEAFRAIKREIKRLGTCPWAD